MLCNNSVLRVPEAETDTAAEPLSNMLLTNSSVSFPPVTLKLAVPYGNIQYKIQNLYAGWKTKNQKTKMNVSP